MQVLINKGFLLNSEKNLAQIRLVVFKKNAKNAFGSVTSFFGIKVCVFFSKTLYTSNSKRLKTVMVTQVLNSKLGITIRVLVTFATILTAKRTIQKIHKHSLNHGIMTYR